MHEIVYKNCPLKIHYINRIDFASSELLKGPSDGRLCRGYNRASSAARSCSFIKKSAQAGQTGRASKSRANPRDFGVTASNRGEIM